jgi:hypothetical protein
MLDTKLTSRTPDMTYINPNMLASTNPLCLHCLGLPGPHRRQPERPDLHRLQPHTERASAAAAPAGQPRTPNKARRRRRLLLA